MVDTSDRVIWCYGVDHYIASAAEQEAATMEAAMAMKPELPPQWMCDDREHQRMPWFERPWGEMILEKSRIGDMVIAYSPEVLFYGVHNVQTCDRILREKRVELVFTHCDYDWRTQEGRARRNATVSRHVAVAMSRRRRPTVTIGWRRSGQMIVPDMPVRSLAAWLALWRERGLKATPLANILKRFATTDGVRHLLRLNNTKWPEQPPVVLPKLPPVRTTSPDGNWFERTRRLLRTGWFSKAEIAEHLGTTAKRVDRYMFSNRNRLGYFLIKDSLHYNRVKFTWCDDHVEQQLLAARPQGASALRRIVTPVPDLAKGAVAPAGRECLLPELPVRAAAWKPGCGGPGRRTQHSAAARQRAHLQSSTPIPQPAATASPCDASRGTHPRACETQSSGAIDRG
jgi:hypothetical protein